MRIKPTWWMFDEPGDNEIERRFKAIGRLVAGTWTAQADEIFVVCDECSRVGVVTPEDADTYARMKCQCGVLVDIPAAETIGEGDEVDAHIPRDKG